MWPPPRTRADIEALSVAALVYVWAVGVPVDMTKIVGPEPPVLEYFGCKSNKSFKHVNLAL